MVDFEMSWITVLIIALGLAMDSFAVSITSGIIIKRPRVSNALKIGAFFGFFQALMPLLGWSTGFVFRSFIANVDHWIAFGLLSFIGIRMIYESLKSEENYREFNPLSVYILFMFSIATSIDAFAVGITFAFLNVSIIIPIIVIGTVTFLLSFSGVFIGDRAGHLFGKRIETMGGIILVAIGIKILVEHLVFYN